MKKVIENLRVIGNPPPVADEEAVRDQIRVLAYRLWQERGCPGGSPELDWLAAEQQVTGQTKPAASGIHGGGTR